MLLALRHTRYTLSQVWCEFAKKYTSSGTKYPKLVFIDGASYLYSIFFSNSLETKPHEALK